MKSESRQRFERECRAVASLSHPNIVPVFEVGNEGPITFLASELVEGTDLAQWVNERDVPESTISAQAIIKACEAVQHAHSRGVIHRDLKPANILLAIDEESEAGIFDPDSIRITDFGLAKFRDEDASLTQTGSVLGTPAFAAPEQLRGEIEDNVAELADVYSLGAVLYFLLTGKAPFSAESVLAMVQKVQTEEPVHPRTIREQVPPDLAAICLKAMDKDSGRRYSGVWELRCDLERYLRDEPTIARPIRAMQKVGRWCRRNSIVASLLALVFVLLLAGFSATYYQWRVAKTNLIEVTRQKNRSDVLLQKTEESIDAMLNTTAESLRNIPSMTGVRKRMLTDALTIQLSVLEEEKTDGVALNAVDSLRRVARIQRELGDYASAIETTESAIALIESVEPKSSDLMLDYSELYLQLTILQTQVGSLNAATLASAEMERLLNEVDPKDLTPEATRRLAIFGLESRRATGVLAEKANRLKEAESSFEEAVLIGANLVEADPGGSHAIKIKQELVSAWNSLAIIRRATGKLDGAYQAYVSSLELNAQLLKERPEERALEEKFSTTSHNFANLLFGQKKFKEAETQYRAAYEMLSDLSLRFPSIYQYRRRLPSTLSGLALVQKKSGDVAAARETTNQSIQLLLQSQDRFGATEEILSSLAFNRRALAGLDCALQDYDAADENFQVAESATRELVESWPANPKYRYELGLTMGNEADSLISRKQFGGAVGLLQKARAEATKSVELDPERVRFRSSLNFINGKLIEAMIGDAQFESAVKLVRELSPPESSSKTMLFIAQAISRGVGHHRNTNEDFHSRESTAPKVEALVDNIFKLLESVIAEGIAADGINARQFNAVADDERFGLLLNKAK